MLEYKASRPCSMTSIYRSSISPSINRVVINSKIVNLKYRYVAPEAVVSLQGPDGEGLQGPDGETLQSP